MAERAGNPSVGSHPGVEKRKLIVVRNIATAVALPTAATRGDHGRAAIIAAIAISTMPRQAENARTLKTPYIQLIKGLFATKG